MVNTKKYHHGQNQPTGSKQGFLLSRHLIEKTGTGSVTILNSFFVSVKMYHKDIYDKCYIPDIFNNKH